MMKCAICGKETTIGCELGYPLCVEHYLMVKIDIWKRLGMKNKAAEKQLKNYRKYGNVIGTEVKG